MAERLRDVSSVGFDLDGTLYPLNNRINSIIRDEISLKILEKDPSLENKRNARNFFEKEYSKIGSASKILGNLGYNNPSEIVNDCLANVDILDLIEKNNDLSKKLKRISNKYEEMYLLTSSPEKLGLLKLDKIGIDNSVFSYMVFGDTPEVGSKSTGDAFNYSLSFSRFPANKHIYFGDSLKSDIEPAREKGMRTVSVGRFFPEADYNLSSINDMEGLL